MSKSKRCTNSGYSRIFAAVTQHDTNIHFVFRKAKSGAIQSLNHNLFDKDMACLLNQSYSTYGNNELLRISLLWIPSLAQLKKGAIFLRTSQLLSGKHLTTGSSICVCVCEEVGVKHEGQGSTCVFVTKMV